MARTGMATGARAGSIRLPQAGVARLAWLHGRSARPMGAALLKLAVMLLCTSPGWAQQTFTGGPYVIPADGGGLNTTVRQTVPVTVATASAIRSISIPLGFRGNPEFEMVGQTGCVVDGTTVNPAGTVCSVVIRFAPLAPGLRSAQIRLVDGSGRVFSLGISGTGFVPQAAIYPALASIVAGSGPSAGGYAGDGSAANAARLNAPQGIVADAFGNSYVADTANHVVRMLDAFGNITTVAGSGSSGYAGDGGPASAATLNGPTWLAVDTAQNLYIADSGNNVIRKVATDGSRTISTVAGNGTAGFLGDGDVAIHAELNNPQGLATDPTGNLYVVDSANRRIRRVDAATGQISTIAGGNEQGFDAGTVDALAAHFNAPTGLAIDASGNLYLADTGNSSIREWVAASHSIVVYAGTGTAGKSGNGASATSARFFAPTGVALNAAGDLFVADTGNAMVRRVEHNTGIVDLYLGRGKTGYTDGVTPSDEVGLSSPMGLAFDASQTLFAVDTANNVVRKVSPSSGAIQFSATAVGNTTAPETVTVSNIGTSNLAFAGLPLTLVNNATSTSFNLANAGATPCGGNLAAGAHCTFTVSFAPQATGFASGEVDATDNSLTPLTATTVQPVYLFGGPMSAILITPTTLTDAVPNTPYSNTLTASGGFGTLTLDEAGTLPSGITVSMSGNTITFQGTPTVNGVYPLTVFATDSLGNTASQAMSLRVAPAPVTINVSETISSSDVPNLLNSITVNVSESIQSSDALRVLPTLTVNVSEAIQGSDGPALLPTLVINVTEAVSAQDAVSTAQPLGLFPASGALADGAFNTPYSQTFAVGGGTGSYTYSSTGTLPPGLSLATVGSTYVLSGTPTRGGTFNFSVSVADGQDAPATNSYSLTIRGAQQSISVGTLPVLTYGGGTFTLPVSATSGLPVTVTVVSGPASGPSPFTITGAGTVQLHATQAGNQNYAAASLDFSVSISPAPLTITADSFTRAFDKPNPAFTYQGSGFVLGQSASVLSGAPTIATQAKPISPSGAYPITIATGTLASTNYTFTFVPGTLTVAPGSAPQTILFGEIPNLHVEQTMLLTARASSGLPVTYTVTGPATLNGPRITATGPGRVTVTASQSGNSNYTAATPVTRSFTAQ